MTCFARPRLSVLLPVATAGLLLAGCAGQCPRMGEPPPPEPSAPAAPAGVPAAPASIPAQELVGRWGYASYHQEADRARTEAAARGQCNQPYVIGRGPSGGVIMHLADSAQPSELILKGGGGKDYVGPKDEPAGGIHDRQIVSFVGRVMILRFVDPEVAGRYGTGVYVRCGSPRA
jgi:hypothetical protein